VSLTGLGRAEFRAMAKEHERWIGEMFGDLSRREVEELLRLLARAKASAGGAVKGARP
jgi:DNA-binding MarR family transcriptional regulator